LIQPFPTTHWSAVVDAGAEGSEARRHEALVSLLGKYTGPMRSHLVTRMRIDADRADDLLQSFIANQVLERDLFAQAKQSKGKFRTFVLVALDRFVLNDLRAASAQKRRPSGERMDAADAADQTVHFNSPDQIFERHWAEAVVSLALERMKRYCAEVGRLDVWGVFEARIVLPAFERVDPASYSGLVQRYQFESPAQASNVLTTAKRTFLRSLESVIGEYELSEQAIADEITDLRRILSL
jgi:RNA polymerase sigma-70 factor (ECF subfamily)